MKFLEGFSMKELVDVLKQNEGKEVEITFGMKSSPVTKSGILTYKKSGLNGDGSVPFVQLDMGSFIPLGVIISVSNAEGEVLYGEEEQK